MSEAPGGAGGAARDLPDARAGDARPDASAELPSGGGTGASAEHASGASVGAIRGHASDGGFGASEDDAPAGRPDTTAALAGAGSPGALAERAIGGPLDARGPADDAPSSNAARDARDAVHFRRATVVVGTLMAAFVALGAGFGLRALFEIGIAFLGFTLVLRAVFETWPAARTRLLTLHPRRFFLETWRALDAESDAARAEDRAKGRWDHHPLVALVAGAICLVCMEYFGHGEHFDRLLAWIEPRRAFEDPTTWAGRLRESEWLELAEFAYWSAWRVLGYLLVPLFVARVILKQRIRDQGLRTQGLSEHAWIYVLGYVVVFLCVVLVARHDEDFRTYYPFYRDAGRSWLDFGAWEILYAAQFFSLEIFFRGFWLKQMARPLGSHAIFAMMVPYCMIHIGKPFPETMAAIVAGIFLGTLAMRTRSIWSGFAIHVSVAVSMDVAALLATTGLPDRLVPWG